MAQSVQIKDQSHTRTGRANFVFLAFQGYDWVEVILLGFIPMVIVGFGVVGVLIRLLAYVYSKCCKTRRVPYRPYSNR